MLLIEAEILIVCLVNGRWSYRKNRITRIHFKLSQISIMIQSLIIWFLQLKKQRTRLIKLALKPRGWFRCGYGYLHIKTQTPHTLSEDHNHANIQGEPFSTTPKLTWSFSSMKFIYVQN